MQQLTNQGASRDRLTGSDHINLPSIILRAMIGVLLWTIGGVATATQPPATRIVTLGDSITKGVRSGVKADETFAAQLQPMLREKGVECEVTNAGIGGERTDQALKRFAKDVIAQKPRIVTIMYGTNDAYVDKGATEPRLTIDQYRDNLHQLVAELRKAGIDPILMTAPRWGDKSPPDGAGDHPNKSLEKYVEACRTVARETKTPLVDNFDHWSKTNATGFDIGQWTTDQYHPNPAGHKVIAELMLPVVRRVLASGGRQPPDAAKNRGADAPRSPIINTRAGEEDLRVLRDDVGPAEPTKMLYSFLVAEAGKHFDRRRATVAELKTPEDVERRQRELRAKFIESLGGFPEKTSLNPRVVGTLKGDGFRVEKVIYESRPNHHVTAALYLPEGRPPFPGVLVPCGHSANGKAAEAYQRISIMLAKNGLAALCFDPIGQGERSQLLNDDGKPAIAGSTTEHSLVGVGALLVGRQTASYRIWDGIRSLDYLANRPNIDATRLGCTGNSGGGTLTAYLMALDDRIVAAAPSCYITSLERLFATIGPQDAEQNITGQVAFGMEHADYVTMRAPRPTLLCIGTQDYFDYSGAWTTFREAKLTYGLLGHGERVDLFEYNDKHGFSRPRREAAMRWMRRWLLGKNDAPVETDFPIFKDDELQCTESGQVLADLSGKSVFNLNAVRAQELGRERLKQAVSSDSAKLLDSIRRLLALPQEIPAAQCRQLETVKRDGYTITKLAFETEPGITVPALAFSAHAVSSPRGPSVVYLTGDGILNDARPGGPIEKLSRSGYPVLALELRGMGETAPGKLAAGGRNFLGVDGKETFLSLHLARPLLGQRVFDVLAIANSAPREHPFGYHLIAVGSAGPIALHATALDERVKRIELQGSISSWSEVVNTQITINQLTNIVPGALATYDLPDLAELVKSRNSNTDNR